MSKKNKEKSKETKVKKWVAKERGRPAAKEREKERSSCHEGRMKWLSSHRTLPQALAIAVVPLCHR